MLAVLNASGRPAYAQEERPVVIVVDGDMTPAAGTIDLLTAQRALATIEDRWLPPARFDESTRVKRGLGIGYRAGKWFALDLPQDHFLMVVGHEIFGHGAGLREIGAHGVQYSFDAPIPYGPGGAVTEFSGDLLVTRADALAIDTSGIEAPSISVEKPSPAARCTIAKRGSISSRVSTACAISAASRRDRPRATTSDRSCSISMTSVIRRRAKQAPSEAGR